MMSLNNQLMVNWCFRLVVWVGGLVNTPISNTSLHGKKKRSSLFSSGRQETPTPPRIVLRNGKVTKPGP